MNLKKILVGAMLMASAAMAETYVVAFESADMSVEASGECTTGKPGPDWVCVGGGWLPPGMPLPGGAIVIPPSAPPAAAGCTTPQPGFAWICVGGGWLPPGMMPPGGVAIVPPPSAPPVAAGCTTPQPGSGWICAGGGWLPPGMTPPAGDATVPTPSTPPAAAGCTTPQPASGWVCVGGGWLPPGMTPSGDETVTGADTGPVLSGSAGGGAVRIMTWNIHFGETDPWGQAREIANSGADVVLLQEAQTWDEHMPTTYPERLRQITGQTWHTIWSEASNPSCGGGCQGTLILSRLPIVTHQTVSVSGTTATRAVIDVGGVHINVFNIHLEYYDTGKRSSQLVQFMDWTKQFGGPQIAGGDFNSWWGEWWIQQMESAYSDTWQDVTGSDEDGYTVHGTVRFDYLFRSYQDSWRITPTGAWVRWTGLSDHGQLVADYIVR